MPTPSDPPPGPSAPGPLPQAGLTQADPAAEPDSGPLKRLSLVVLLALAVEIGLLALLGKAA
jgi:hypothetical protein